VRGVLGRVHQRLLRSPGEGEPGIGGQRAGITDDCERYLGAMTALVIRAELGQSLRQRRCLAAQGMDRPAGLGQAVGGHPASLFEELHCPRLVVGVGEDGLGELNLKSERAQRVREHVVDLAGDPGPLVQGRRPGPLLAQLLRPGGQSLCLLGLNTVSAPVQPNEKAHEQRGCIPGDGPAVPAAGQGDRCGRGHAQRPHGPPFSLAGRSSRGDERDHAQHYEVRAVRQHCHGTAGSHDRGKAPGQPAADTPPC
jgi:hypothetical protein